MFARRGITAKSSVGAHIGSGKGLDVPVLNLAWLQGSVTGH